MTPDPRVIEPGERMALVWMLTRSPNVMPTFFDVGANVGDWTAEVVKRFPSAEIHAFEPQKEALDEYNARFPDAFANDVALSDRPGHLALKRDTPRSYHASAHRVRHDVLGSFKQVVHARTQSLDGYCMEQHVSHVNFLKIDTEGHEYNVLLGARRMLTMHDIDVIQFEFNSNAWLAGQKFDDFWDLLSGYGYRFVRENPGYLEPMAEVTPRDRRYEPLRNYLAIRDDLDWWWS